MNAQIRILKADLTADLASITEIYQALHRCGGELTSEDQRIVVAYHLHNLYCAFESIFQRIAEVFGNHSSDEAGWHADLLRRMTLEIEGLRPRLLSESSYDTWMSCAVSGIFFGALALVLKKALMLESVYRTDMDRFLAFLDSLS
jgi:hypothetical protein